MYPTKTAAVTLAVALLVGTVPAFAQHGGGGSRGGGRTASGGYRAAPRAAAPRQPGAPRGVAPVAGARTMGPYGAARPVPFGPRAYSYAAQRTVGPRGGGGVAPRAVPRTIGPRGTVAPFRFYRPYYVFRPRVSLGFGFWAGFPISYPYYYGYYDSYYGPYPYGYVYAYPPYAYPYPYPYPAASYPPYSPNPYPPSASGSVNVQPFQTQANTGGVSFEITPANAQVFVDGSYVGTADQFTPSTQPLGLTPGRHRIEVRAPGYRTMAFDADIIAGQVIPYQGTMQP